MRRNTGIVLAKRKPKFGVGINDADYKVQLLIRENGRLFCLWKCPFYVVWSDMLMRCYSEKYQRKSPTYVGCTVCEEWLIFSNFKAWMEKQDWEGKVLDKDLLVEGNKIYSPSTCKFLPNEINQFLCAVNVLKPTIRVIGNKFSTRISIKRQEKYLSFDTKEEAIIGWKGLQIDRINSLIEKYQEDLDIVNKLSSLIVKVQNI